MYKKKKKNINSIAEVRLYRAKKTLEVYPFLKLTAFAIPKNILRLLIL